MIEVPGQARKVKRLQNYSKSFIKLGNIYRKTTRIAIFIGG